MSARNRPETTKMLSDLTIQLIDPHGDQRIYWAREVTFDYRTKHKVRVDFMQFKPVNNSIGGIEHGDFYCFEVKSSVEDFHSKNGHTDLTGFGRTIRRNGIFGCTNAARTKKPVKNTAGDEFWTGSVCHGRMNISTGGRNRPAFLTKKGE